MQYALGFAIALFIGLTGVGGGVITAPVLTLFLGVAPAEAVGTALVFTAIVKWAAAPVYLLRRQVNFRVLALLLAGGLPGVIAGTYALDRLHAANRKGPIVALLGASIIAMAALNLYRLFARPVQIAPRDRSRWLPLIAVPVGAEVGFSSAGAGALGSLVLMAMTNIPAAQVIGTDVLFGLGLSLAGGAVSVATGNYESALVWKMAAGGVLGAFAGANLLAVLPAKPLRIALSLWLVSLGGELCWQAVAG